MCFIASTSASSLPRADGRCGPFSVAVGADFDHIPHEFSACASRAIAGLECPHAAGRDVHGIEPKQLAIADLDLKAEPVSTVHAAGGIKSYGDADLAGVVLSGAGKEALPEILAPRGAADQRLV